MTGSKFCKYLCDKISESYCIFNGQYHEYIKRKHRKSNTFIQKLLKYWIFLFKLLTARNIRYSKKLKACNFLKLSVFDFWLWENLNFPVWTYSIISRCYYKCNKRKISLIKAMLCRIRIYFAFMEHTSFCFDVLTFVCNWWQKLFTAIRRWTQTFCGCLLTSINKIWVFYDVLHALSSNKCL